MNICRDFVRFLLWVLKTETDIRYNFQLSYKPIFTRALLGEPQGVMYEMDSIIKL